MYLHKPEEYKKKVAGEWRERTRTKTRETHCFSLCLRASYSFGLRLSLIDYLAMEITRQLVATTFEVIFNVEPSIFSRGCNFLLDFLADYVRKYATEEALRDQENSGTENGVSSDSESSMSDFSEDEAQDMEL